MKSGDVLNLMFFEFANHGQLLLDEDFNIFRVTKKGELSFIKGTNIFDYFDDVSCRLLMESMEQLDEEFISFKNIYLKGKNGLPFEGIIIKQNNIYRMFIKDLSSNMEMLQKLMFFYRNFINNPNPMFITNIEGVILDANKALYDLYSYSVDEVIGSKPNIFKSFRQSPLEYKKMWTSLLNKDIGQYKGSIYNRKKDGTEIFVNVFVNTVFDSKKNILGFIATHFEATKQKSIEEKAVIKDYEANLYHNELLNILSIVSHDIKGQIGGIINYLEIMEHKRARDYKDYLEKAKALAFSLHRFVSDTLSIAKVEKGLHKAHFSRCHILSLLKECISNWTINAEKKDVKIILNEKGGNCAIVCDSLKTEEIFNNLLENAIKYTEKGKEVTVNFIERGDLIEIEFIDSGKGVDEKMIDKLFQPFYVADSRKEGYGLGLYIVKNYTELQGWSISVKNREDKKGSIFKLTIRKDANKTFESSVVAIYDPTLEFVQTIDELFKDKNIVTYKPKNLYELTRLYKIENPEIILINIEIMDDDLRAFLIEVKNKKKKENYQIGFGREDFCDEIFDVCVSVDKIGSIDFKRFFSK